MNDLPFPFPKKSWKKNEWNQLKGLTKIEMIRLLEKDDRWEHVATKGSRYIFYNPDLPEPFRYVEIHHHREGYRDKGLLRKLIDHICWTREDLRNWGVIR